MSDDTESTERCQRVEPEVGFEHEGPTCVTHNDGWGECRTTPADDTETQRVERGVGILIAATRPRGSHATSWNPGRESHHEWASAIVSDILIAAGPAARAAGDDLAVERERIAQAIETEGQKHWGPTLPIVSMGTAHNAYRHAAHIARTNPGEGGAE